METMNVSVKSYSRTGRGTKRQQEGDITIDSDLEDFDNGEDHKDRKEHGAFGALDADTSSSTAPKTPLDSAKPGPPRPSKKQVTELTKMAAGKLDGDQGKTIALHGIDTALAAESMLDKHVPKMVGLLAKVESGGIGLRDFCKSSLFHNMMGFKSICFTVANPSMLPLLAACDAGKTHIALFLALCGIRKRRISRKSLEGPPGQQSNDSLAGASAAVEVLKRALFELMPELEQLLVSRGFVFEDLIEYFNLFDLLDACCRVGMKK